jgi:uncharacterized protein (DUF1499 family)
MMPGIRPFITFMLFISAKALVRVHLVQKSSSPAVHQPSRAEFLYRASAAFGGLLLKTSPSRADEEVPPKPPKISACKLQGGKGPSNCVSTSSVRQVECYVAPWTFECTATEAQSRLKGVFVADPLTYNDIYEEKDYIRVKAGRGLVTDELEFVFDEEGKFVKMRSAELTETPSISDFGANRRRIDGIRKEAKVFDVMGGSYDAVESRGTGPMGQLKAFYGLQSGAGFEGLYED